MSDTKLREKADALIAFTPQGPRFIAWVQAVTDALAPATEKAAKVETMADRIAADLKAGTFRGEQPAPPEPAAPVNGSTPVGEYDPDMKPAAREMPEALAFACSQLRQVGLLATVEKIKHYWRNLAQPVECKDCLKLIDERDRREEQIGRAAAALGMEDEWTSACDVGDALIERCEEISAAANSVLIQQAAQGRKVELGKVRELVNDLKRALSEAAPSEMTMLDPHEWRSDLDAVSAELDAAEGKRRE